MTVAEKPILEPTTQAFVDSLAAQKGKPIYELSYKDARKVLEDAQAKPVAKLPADIEDKVLPAGPTGEVSVRIYRPQNAKSPLPTVMYFHGGGWVLGSKDTHDRLLRDLTNGAQAAFVFVNYTPSPEAQFPVPIEQDYAATKYIAEHGKEFGLDTSRLAVAGDSVGGNMVAVVTQLAKERKGPAIRYQVLLYPVTDAGMNTASYSEFANGPWLTKPAMEWFWNAYAPKKEDRKKTTASPLVGNNGTIEGPAARAGHRRRERRAARRRRGIREKAHRGRRRRDGGAHAGHASRLCPVECVGPYAGMQGGYTTGIR